MRVCRIARIISSPGGHALLVGVGGSGKQSLARLASYICGYTTVTIVISGNYSLNNFREDLQKMYKRAGGCFPVEIPPNSLAFLHGNGVSRYPHCLLSFLHERQYAGLKGEGLLFLLTDSQIVDEKMLVYVNDLLASGEIPDLFPQEDKDEIINAMRPETKAAGLLDSAENCWATFIGWWQLQPCKAHAWNSGGSLYSSCMLSPPGRLMAWYPRPKCSALIVRFWCFHYAGKVKTNLHVAFTASPVGEAFRVRSQRFLATINATVIDWFQPWPEVGVAVERRQVQGPA